MAKQLPQGVGVNDWSHGEHCAFLKTTVGDQHMQVGVVADQIAQGLDHDDHAGQRGFMLRK